MEIFVGNDIIEVSRIANLIENDKFLHRVFSDAEIEYKSHLLDAYRIK